MGAAEKLQENIIETQEQLFLDRIDEVLGYVQSELENPPCDETDLDCITCSVLPNITVYIDYAIEGFGFRHIEIDRIDVLNSDDEHLFEAERILRSALTEFVYVLNDRREKESLYHIDY
ncbi:MAG: hypothetical protein ACLVKO_09125 [Dysgonomonas sp.]